MTRCKWAIVVSHKPALSSGKRTILLGTHLVGSRASWPTCRILCSATLWDVFKFKMPPAIQFLQFQAEHRRLITAQLHKSCATESSRQARGRDTYKTPFILGLSCGAHSFSVSNRFFIQYVGTKGGSDILLSLVGNQKPSTRQTLSLGSSSSLAATFIYSLRSIYMRYHFSSLCSALTVAEKNWHFFF